MISVQAFIGGAAIAAAALAIAGLAGAGGAIAKWARRAGRR